MGVEFGAFYAGALHVVVGFETMAPLLTLAFYAALQPIERARWMLLSLPLGLLIGASVALDRAAAAQTIAAANVMIAATLLAPGLLAAAAWRLPAIVSAALAALTGVVVGAVTGAATHEAEAFTAPIDAALYAGGVVAAGVLVGTLAIAIATKAGAIADWAPLGLRVLGSWAAAIGGAFFALTLAG